LVQAGGSQRNVNVADVGQDVGSPPEFRRLSAGSTQQTGAAPAQAGGAQPATQTTAALSGGGTGANQISDRGQQILDGAAKVGSWLGAQGQKVVQAILVTEGGLNNARGDNGQSAGPLQFFSGGPGNPGQLDAFARFLGTTVEQAKTYVEQHPLEAV